MSNITPDQYFASIASQECPNATRDEIEAAAQRDDPEVFDALLTALEKLERIVVIRDSRLC